MNLNKWDLPPIEKIHEALSAIADERIEMHDTNAYVTSSNNDKKYIITWEDNFYASNDNASYYQGYLGYPVITVLFMQNKLTLDKKIAEYFKNINWHELNNRFKRKYSEVVAYLLAEMANKNIDTEEINNYVNKVYDEIKKLDILYKRSKQLPPK